MGRDGVELVAIEDTFQIEIADEEAGRISTVGDLHRLVVAKLQGRPSDRRCLTSAAFYRTRRGITDVLQIGPREVRPATLLENLLPRERRRENWRRIQEAMDLRLPELRHPGRLVLTVLAVSVTITP